MKMLKSRLFETILAFDRSLANYVANSDYPVDYQKYRKNHAETFKTLYRYLAIDGEQASLVRQDENIFNKEEGDIWTSHGKYGVSASTRRFLSPRLYNKYIDKMYQMNGIPNADYAELVFKGPVEGIPVTERAYWVVEQEEDVDYSWQKEVLINGSFKILSIDDVDDPRTPKLIKRYILKPVD